MAQRPTFPSPYLNSIDATADNDFICLINDRDVIKAYTLRIIDMSKSEEITYSEGSGLGVNVELSSPIYGGKGNDSYLIVTVPADTLTNGSEYKWTISLTDSLDNTVKSKEYYFKCIEEATLEIESSDINNGVLAKANATFIGKYKCPSLITYYRFILYKDNEIIKDTGEIYSQYISFDYDMFIQGNYSLILQVENEGKAYSEESLDFTVNYISSPTNVAPKCYVSSDENSIVVDFSEVMAIPGTYVPNTKHQQINVTDSLNGAYIPKNTKLYWEQRVGVSEGLDIDEGSFSIYLMVNLPYGKQGKIIEISGDNTISVSFDGFNINYQYSNGLMGSTSIYQDNEYFFASIPTGEEIDNDKIYAFSFDETDEYNFIEEYKYVLQNPMNVYWWLITITQNGVTITKGAEAVV